MQQFLFFNHYNSKNIQNFFKNNSKKIQKVSIFNVYICKNLIDLCNSICKIQINNRKHEYLHK